MDGGCVFRRGAGVSATAEESCGGRRHFSSRWFSTEGGNRRGGCVFRSGAGVSAADGILAAAFLFNLWYVLGSWGNVRQYDYYNFVMHTDYFLQNGFFLAAPAAYLQSVYFQPPLWGLVSAAVTKFCMWFGAGREAAFDSVRFVSLFCITGAGIVFWRLLREFKLKDGVRLGLFALFCFFRRTGLPPIWSITMRRFIF